MAKQNKKTKNTNVNCTKEQEIVRFLTKRIQDLKKRKGFGDKVARNVTHFELIKLHWVVGYKNLKKLSWKEIMGSASLNMIFTRGYRRILWKLHEQKNLEGIHDKLKYKLINEASKFDPLSLTVEDHLEEIKRFYPQIEDDKEFEDKYKELYNIHMEDLMPVKSDSIKRKLCHHFDVVFR